MWKHHFLCLPKSFAKRFKVRDRGSGWVMRRLRFLSWLMLKCLSVGFLGKNCGRKKGLDARPMLNLQYWWRSWLPTQAMYLDHGANTKGVLCRAWYSPFGARHGQTCSSHGEFHWAEDPWDDEQDIKRERKKSHLALKVITLQSMLSAFSSLTAISADVSFSVEQYLHSLVYIYI